MAMGCPWRGDTLADPVGTPVMALKRPSAPPPPNLKFGPHLGRFDPLVARRYCNGPRLLEGKSGPGRNLASVLVLLRVLVDRN